MASNDWMSGLEKKMELWPGSPAQGDSLPDKTHNKSLYLAAKQVKLFGQQ